MILKVKGLNKEDERTYKGEWFTLTAHKHSCPFCLHCTDILFDFTNGPYMFFCLKDAEQGGVLQNGCKEFKDNDESRTDS